MSEPPEIPANWRQSRFQNHYGEEWVFGQDPETGRIVLAGADLDWTPLQPRRVDCAELAAVLHELSKTSPFLAQTALAGLTRWLPLLGKPDPPSTLVVLGGDGGWRICNHEETLWIAACLVGSRHPPAALTGNELRQSLLTV